MDIFCRLHNAVNERTHKLTISYAEAEEHLTKQLAEFQWTPDKIEHAFFQDWWTALLMTTFSVSLTPDNPKEDEKKEYQAFIRDAVSVVPFAFKPSIRTILVAFVDSPDFKLNSRDDMFESLTNLHNSVCSEFGRVPKTVKEMKELFAQHFEQKVTTNLVRANQIHEEDNKKLLALQEELRTLKELKVNKTNETNETNETSANNNYQTATIALASILGVLLLVILAYKLRVFGDWRFIKVSSKMKSNKENKENKENEENDEQV
jgi:hypothetical protein